MAPAPHGLKEIVTEAVSMPYIEEMGKAVARTLHRGLHVAELNLQPGNGTSYKLLFIPLDGTIVCPPRVVAGQEWGSAVGPEGAVVVAWLEHQAYYVQSWDLSWDYIEEHWNSGSHDAMVLSLLFAAIGKSLEAL